MSNGDASSAAMHSNPSSVTRRSRSHGTSSSVYRNTSAPDTNNTWPTISVTRIQVGGRSGPLSTGVNDGLVAQRARKYSSAARNTAPSEAHSLIGGIARIPVRWDRSLPAETVLIRATPSSGSRPLRDSRPDRCGEHNAQVRVRPGREIDRRLPAAEDGLLEAQRFDRS